MLVQRTVAVTKSLVGRNAIQLRNSTIAAPARNKVSAAEKAVLGLTMCAGVCAIPTWVLLNLKAYRGEN